MREDKEAALAAPVLNCAWMVRHYPRAHQAALRHRAIRDMAEAVRAALDQAGEDPEPVLYAVAIGLYDRHDERFRV